MKTLKKPSADQVGLKKLPKFVRNKMGYMKHGGTVEEYGKGGSVKDACYHKVKKAELAAGNPWPSAYASGRLAKCRKMGVNNYGKGKK
tara:strand:+ start:310 stop:573 length:264 start_codon:yes stop_codon:yes gene_type:complete